MINQRMILLVQGSPVKPHSGHVKLLTSIGWLVSTVLLRANQQAVRDVSLDETTSRSNTTSRTSR